ncbi:MAG: DUF2818 family protein [Gammaproteobacteria bacterium]|nr:DUF2818 family protein [Gammaproteobacteria bacterium]MDH5513873.1 DUF2818 family protein [Gammaproteobacteria bacterium]
MSEQTAVWILLGLAFVAANLPWLSERMFFLHRPASGHKPVGSRLLEWLLMYFIAGGIALGVEHKLTGGTHAQDWEFYAVTACLFIIFALPGFIYHVELKTQLARARRRRVTR